MTQGHRLLLKWARMVHVYLTLFGLALLLFFAVTGFMLNHDDWFGPEEQTQTTTGSLPPKLLKEPDKLAIVELLRKDFGASGVMDSFDAKDEDSVRVVFKSPGMQFEAVVQRADGMATMTRTSRGFAGLVTDLHRGKATGLAWGLIIDSVCVLLLIIATTGLILWQSLRGRARHGLAVMLLGAAISVVVYFAFVP
jgi:hypothetical protein